MWTSEWATDDNPDTLRKNRGADMIGSGLVGQVAGLGALFGIAKLSVPAFWLAWISFMLGTIVLYLGCRRLAKHKGWSGAWAVLSLISLPGLLVILCLPDQFQKAHRMTGFDVIPRGPRPVSTLWVAETESDGRQIGPRPKPWDGIH